MESLYGCIFAEHPENYRRPWASKAMNWKDNLSSWKLILASQKAGIGMKGVFPTRGPGIVGVKQTLSGTYRWNILFCQIINPNDRLPLIHTVVFWIKVVIFLLFLVVILVVYLNYFALKCENRTLLITSFIVCDTNHL